MSGWDWVLLLFVGVFVAGWLMNRSRDMGGTAAPTPTIKPTPAQIPAPDDAGSSAFSGVYRFDYMDGEGEVAEREAFITHVSESSGRRYFEGFRTDTHEDRSYRVDRVMGDMLSIDTGELTDAELLADLFGDPVERDTDSFVPAGGAGRSDWRTGVCFHGFGRRELAELTGLAAAADWMVFERPHHAADYLVAHDDAADEVMEEADDLGITVISADTFRAMV